MRPTKDGEVGEAVAKRLSTSRVLTSGVTAKQKKAVVQMNKPTKTVLHLDDPPVAIQRSRVDHPLLLDPQVVLDAQTGDLFVEVAPNPTHQQSLRQIKEHPKTHIAFPQENIDHPGILWSCSPIEPSRS